MSLNKFALYVHIPFCVSKCSYCDFCSFVPKNEQVSAYLQALNAEIKAKGEFYKNYQVTSIYIGGGTPSILPKNVIFEILKNIKTNFKISGNSITIEANPNSFTLEKAQEFKEAGCNRISFGLQSHNDEILKILNRKHNFQDLVNAVNYAHKVGINDINVDFMFGVPTQDLEDVKESLNRVTNLDITHISCYGLILEPNTPLYNEVKNKELQLPSDDECVNMYDYAVDFLSKHGFFRYEISNFAKKGYESVHNKNYWARGEYLGLGLASHSFIKGVHWHNTSNFNKYLSTPLNCMENIEPETLKTAKEETIMLALRTEKGLNIQEYNKKFQSDFLKEYKNTISKLSTQNLITIKNDYIKINDFNISNAIIAEFF